MATDTTAPPSHSPRPSSSASDQRVLNLGEIVPNSTLTYRRGITTGNLRDPLPKVVRYGSHFNVWHGRQRAGFSLGRTIVATASAVRCKKVKPHVSILAAGSRQFKRSQTLGPSIDEPTIRFPFSVPPATA